MSNNEQPRLQIAIAGLAESSRCLGVAQSKDDKGAIPYWEKEVDRYVKMVHASAETASELEQVWGVWSNTDLTEGRGYTVLIGWSRSKSAALRLGAKKGVMGSDATVAPMAAYKSGRTLYVPWPETKATEDDEKQDAQRQLREEAVAKALAAGLTDDDIKAIAGRRP